LGKTLEKLGKHWNNSEKHGKNLGKNWRILEFISEFPMNFPLVLRFSRAMFDYQRK